MYAPLAVLWREAAIGTGLGIALGLGWKVAFGAPTTSTYKQYYNNYSKIETESAFDKEKLNEKIEEILAAARALKE